MTGIALRFDRVGKSYAGVAALDEVSLTVERGEFVALVGVNGAGKTTLLKCLLDFCDTDRGAIEILGIPHLETRARRELAYLPERFSPPYFLTGRDFVRHMLRLYGEPYDEEQALRTFAALDLDPAALGRAARSYSKGMTQKLGIAACLLSGRALYVLDEPAGGLDPRARAMLKNELRALHGAGRTIFFTSHSLADVAELCDRLIVLHAGRVYFTGSPDELVRARRASDLESAFLDCIGGPRSQE